MSVWAKSETKRTCPNDLNTTYLSRKKWTGAVLSLTLTVKSIVQCSLQAAFSANRCRNSFWPENLSWLYFSPSTAFCPHLFARGIYLPQTLSKYVNWHCKCVSKLQIFCVEYHRPKYKFSVYLHLTIKTVSDSSTFVRAVILAESSTSHFRMTRLLFLPSLWAWIFAVLGNARLGEGPPTRDRRTNAALMLKSQFDLACSFPDGSPRHRWTNEPLPPLLRPEPQTQLDHLRWPPFVAAVSVGSGMGTLRK